MRQWTKPGAKWVVPLESNPLVFSQLAHSLGAPSSVQVVDVLSLDEPALLALVPRPVHALVFLFPTTARSEAHYAAAEQGRIPTASTDVLFYPQTIHNACGTFALVNALINTPLCPADSVVGRLVHGAQDRSLEERGQFIHDLQELEDAHNAVAGQGDTVAPTPETFGDRHGFMSFVERGGTVWEIRGGSAGPRPVEGARGEDALERLLVGARQYVQREHGEVVEFACLAVVG